MEEQPRTRPHTVTTTASSFAENFSTSSSSFAYDREFLRTAPGLLIVAEIVSAGPGGGGGGTGVQRDRRARLGREPAQVRGRAFSLRLACFPKRKIQRPPLRARSSHLGEEACDPQGVHRGRNPTCGPGWVMEAHPGSWMVGEPRVYVNESHGHLVPPLPALHVGGLLPKAKLCNDAMRGEERIHLFPYLPGSKVEVSQGMFTEYNPRASASEDARVSRLVLWHILVWAENIPGEEAEHVHSPLPRRTWRLRG